MTRVLSYHSGEGHKFDYLNYKYLLSEEESKATQKLKTKMLMRIVRDVYNNELTQKQREVFYHVMIKELKQKDVAKLLGLSCSTVSRHLKAALRKFEKGYSYFLECYKEAINEIQ